MAASFLLVVTLALSSSLPRTDGSFSTTNYLFKGHKFTITTNATLINVGFTDCPCHLSINFSLHSIGIFNVTLDSAYHPTGVTVNGTTRPFTTSTNVTNYKVSFNYTGQVSLGIIDVAMDIPGPISTSLAPFIAVAVALLIAPITRLHASRRHLNLREN